MRVYLQSLVLVFCLSVCGCATADLKTEGGASGAKVAYVHPYSKFSFPEKIENFRFTGVHNYDREGKDISAGYDSPTPVAATVYVYPAAKNFALLPSPAIQDVGLGLIDMEFQNRKKEISHFHPDARLLEEGWYQLVQGDRHFQGRKAVYFMGYNFGPAKQDSFSELYVFLIEPGVMFLVNDRQYVEYRFSYPTNMAGPAAQEIGSFLSELTWPPK